MFDCIVQLIQILKSNSEAINQCLDYCSLQRLTDNDIKFLEEYCQVRKNYVTNFTKLIIYKLFYILFVCILSYPILYIIKKTVLNR